MKKGLLIVDVDTISYPIIYQYIYFMPVQLFRFHTIVLNMYRLTLEISFGVYDCYSINTRLTQHSFMIIGIIFNWSIVSRLRKPIFSLDAS